MNEKDLKPCPFCGGRAEIVDAEPIEGAVFVECYDCTARGPISRRRQAVDAWNTRVDQVCHNASYRIDESRFHCSECGFGCWVKNVATGREKLPNHCPNCGAKVVE